MLFLVVLHYKIRGQPAQARAGPSPARKLRLDVSSWMVMGRIFSARNNIIFFNPARTEKCSGLERTITLPSGQHLSKGCYPKRVGLYPFNSAPRAPFG
jgi:hypothetical protein